MTKEIDMNYHFYDGIINPPEEKYCEICCKNICNDGFIYCSSCLNSHINPEYLNFKIRHRIFDFIEDICTCCGEQNRRFLNIVAKEGRYVNCPFIISLYGDQCIQFINWFINNRNIKDDFSCLCFNCINGKFYNEGICPHKTFPKPNPIKYMKG